MPVLASDVRTAMTSWTARPNCHRFGRDFRRNPEADLIGVSARGRDLGAIQSCDRTVCSWGTDPNRIRAFSIVFAGLIALGGAWLMNHLDNNLI